MGEFRIESERYPVSFNPPIIALGIRDTRDTFKNIQDFGEFVVGIPGPELVAEIEIAGKAFPRDVSEFEKAGLTAVPSRVVKPYRIKECARLTWSAGWCGPRRRGITSSWRERWSQPV